MERAERIIALGFALLFDGLMVPILWVMLALTLFTAGQRFVKVWRQASIAQPLPPRPARAKARRARRTARAQQVAARRAAWRDRVRERDEPHRTEVAEPLGARSALPRVPRRRDRSPSPAERSRSDAVSRAARARSARAAMRGRRSVVERNLRRIHGDDASRKQHVDREVEPGLRQLRPLLARVVPPPRHPPGPHRGRHGGRGLRAHRRRPRQGRRRDPRPAPPGRLGVGRVLAGREQGPQGHRGRRAGRAAGAGRVVRRAAARHRHQRRPARAVGRHRVRPRPQGQPRPLPAVRPRPGRRRGRGRVLRRADHAARRPGHARPPHRARRSCRPPSTSTAPATSASSRPPLEVERQGKLRDDVARITQDLADELEVLIRRAPDQWHLMQPNWPSDHEELPKSWSEDPGRG